jgi:regulator of RNase E activity RraA
MNNEQLVARFAGITTANVADGCLRAGVELRCAPAGTHSSVPGLRFAGAALPARHVGSVDVFLEAFEEAAPGDILIVDNAGRLDESCVGDLVALEAREAGIGGIVIWGLHRDSADIRAIGLPVFSLGALSAGPLSAADRPSDALERALVGTVSVTRDDVVFADEDGVVFVPASAVDEVLAHAATISAVEGRQADRIRDGVSLREQVRFADYLAAREQSPALTFREHLRAVGGEIEV